MQIAIPSYNRPEITTTRILTAFRNDEITIFVNDESQRELYQTQNGINCNIQITNTKGITAARNAILNYYKTDEEIVMLDDDISGVEILKINPKTLKKDLVPMTNTEILDFFICAFRDARKNNAGMWGVYPVHNPFFMKNRISNNGFIIGSLCGIINSDLRYDENLIVKEDYDFTLQHILKYKKVIRYDYITPRIKHYSNKGGCVEQRKENPGIEADAVRYLLEKYPAYVKLNPKRENEILLNI